MGFNVGGNADSDVEGKGAEVAITLNPAEGLSLVGSVAYARSELASDDPSIGGREGEQVPGIPEWSAALWGNYDFSLGSSIDAFVGTGLVYRDERNTSFTGGGGIAPANPNFTVPSYVTVDLRAGITAGRYQVSVYATNLFNEYAFQAATNAPFGGTASILTPRTIGAVLAVAF